MWEYIVLFLQIMLINIVLSGDNAVVIALASKNLPLDKRKQAIWWGAFGAIALRLILTIVAVGLLQVPYIKAAGSLLLLYIAIKLLIDDEGEAEVREATTLGKAIWTIILADFVMSLDNVLAIAAAAKDNLTVIILGIALSVPIIIWGSTMVMNLLHRFPVLVYIGAGILGYTSGEMLLKDEKVGQFIPHGALHTLLPILLAGVVILCGLAKKLRERKA
jgi:YjbE family integral membrane protein